MQCCGVDWGRCFVWEGYYCGFRFVLANCIGKGFDTVYGFYLSLSCENIMIANSFSVSYEFSYQF
jgi:hypothetical protein